jgi:predicted flap endonuclease-1-like 5' DNA nuclease
MLFLVAQTFVLLVLATIVGLAAGWLIWGGSRRATEVASPAVLTEMQSELSTARAEAENRANDVARLRRKLKRAVEELENHAVQLESAEEKIHALSAANAEGIVLPIEDTELHAELVDTRSRLDVTAMAHADALGQIESLGTEHSNLRDQLRFAEARVSALEDELASRRDATAGDSQAALAAQAHVAALDRELADAQTVIRDAAERVTYLEQQALLWQNEADRLQAVVDETASQVEAERRDAELVRQDLTRQHDTALATLKMDASSGRLRADAAAEHLARLQRELRGVTERSAAQLEATKSSLADLERQVAVAHATLSDANPPSASAPVSAVVPETDQVGLGSLPGMTPTVLANLHELGVSSLVDVAGWTDGDVARISAWIPEAPDVIAANDWVGAARALLAGGSVVGSTNGS